MLLKITEKCSAGCIHCMNDAKPNGKHMSEKTVKDAIEFICDNDLCRSIIVSGGEPTEHPEFMKMMNIIIDTVNQYDHFRAITITSNGFWVLDHQDEAKSLVDRSTPNCVVLWQISTDSRYYVQKLDTTKRIWRTPGFALCEDCVEKITLMGRAKDNNLAPDNRKSCSSCCNLRMVCRQMWDRDHNSKLRDVLYYLESIGRMCTPAIKIDGTIGAGESDLCPTVSNIYKHVDQIYGDLIYCKCNKCGNNDNLDDQYKKLLNLI